MLVSGCFFLMRSLPALQIPNLKSPAPTDERDLALESGFLAKFFRQNEPPLPVRGGMLGARMELPQKHTPIAGGNVR